MDHKNIADGLANIIIDAAAVPNRLHDGGKVVIQQHQIGGLSGHLSAFLPHGDANIGVL